MDLFQHNGFQTVEFGLLLVWAVWLLLGRDVSWRFLSTWCLLGILGLLGLRFWGEQFPVLPFFVSCWRLVATLVGASVAGEFLVEWRQFRRGLVTHLFGIGLALSGVVSSWWDNWEVVAATLLIVSFLGLGYCARANRIQD